MSCHDKEKCEVSIRLKTYVALGTKTKLFCGCRNSCNDDKNTNTCPICLGHPGTLPVINRKAVDFALKIAVALDCDINKHTIFHRKNYFYPDLSKNYQISQCSLPIGKNGYLDLDVEDPICSVGIADVHLEEAHATSVPAANSGNADKAKARIYDFNQAGAPLAVIVSAADIKTPGQARKYMISLKDLIFCLCISDCSMQKGSLYFDVNISVRQAGKGALGADVEIKNINSLKFLKKGLDDEISRQIILLQEGKELLQQTRCYDDSSNTAKPIKADDKVIGLGCFTEPDLEPVDIASSMLEKIKEEIHGLLRTEQ